MLLALIPFRIWESLSSSCFIISSYPLCIYTLMELHLGLLPLGEVTAWDSSRYLRLMEIMSHVTGETQISFSRIASLIMETTQP